MIKENATIFLYYDDMGRRLMIIKGKGGV